MATEVITVSGRRCGKRSRQLARLYALMAAEPAWRAIARSATQFVPGVGVYRPTVMLIGEAPGRHEDQAGAPFVGPAGKELDLCLKLAELQRRNCYITNIVKYRPPGNRTPYYYEVAAGMSWLVPEITLLDPDIIVTLGRTPLQGFFPAERITQVHGVRMTWQDRWFVPMYHPAAGLRAPAIKREIYQDFENLVGCEQWG
jgi:uracil-DNA glycosylase